MMPTLPSRTAHRPRTQTTASVPCSFARLKRCMATLGLTDDAWQRCTSMRDVQRLAKQRYHALARRSHPDMAQPWHGPTPRITPLMAQLIRAAASAQGASLTLLARQYHVTPQYIWALIHARHTLTRRARRVLTTDECTTIQHASRAGASQRALARQYHVSRASIRAIVLEDAAPSRQKIPAADVPWIQQCWHGSVPAKTLATRFGVSKSYIAHIIAHPDVAIGRGATLPSHNRGVAFQRYTAAYLEIMRGPADAPLPTPPALPWRELAQLLTPLNTTYPLPWGFERQVSLGDGWILLPPPFG